MRAGDLVMILWIRPTHVAHLLPSEVILVLDLPWSVPQNYLGIDSSNPIKFLLIMIRFEKLGNYPRLYATVHEFLPLIETINSTTVSKMSRYYWRLPDTSGSFSKR